MTCAGALAFGVEDFGSAGAYSTEILLQHTTHARGLEIFNES